MSHPNPDAGPGPASRRTLIEALAADLLPWPACEPARAARRQRMIAHRRERTLALGPCMRLQFEDALTVHHQVQEVLRAERIADAHALRREAEAYAHLLPDGTGWKATLLIELPDAAERARLLPRLSLAAHRIHLDLAGERVTAAANEDLASGDNARHLERPSGVHFLRFALGDRLRAAVHAGAAATLGCDDAACPWRQPLPAALLMRLRADLLPAPPRAPARALPASSSHARQAERMVQ